MIYGIVLICGGIAAGWFLSGYLDCMHWCLFLMIALWFRIGNLESKIEDLDVQLENAYDRD